MQFFTPYSSLTIAIHLGMLATQAMQIGMDPQCSQNAHLAWPRPNNCSTWMFYLLASSLRVQIELQLSSYDQHLVKSLEHMT